MQLFYVIEFGYLLQPQRIRKTLAFQYYRANFKLQLL